jgi:hypothetical protein
MVSGTYQKLHAVHHGGIRAALRTLLALLTLCCAVACGAADESCSGADTSPVKLHPEFGNGARFGAIRLLGSVRLATRRVDGLSVHGLSGLAWSAPQRRLYAVSDRGFVLHLTPRFADGMLVGASYCAAHALQDPNGVALKGRWRDAEGLSLRARGANDAEELLISFEQYPRIARYSRDGRLLGTLQLPPELREPSHYAGPNRALEALTETRRFGVMVAPESALAPASHGSIPLFSLHGARWAFHALDTRHGGLVGMETLPDDNLLVLERRYISPFRPLIIALSRVTLSDVPTSAVTQQELARFDTTAGWSMDNFESVAHHEANRYFMISDDNASPLQHTLLMYFEIMNDDASALPRALPAAPLSRH